MENIPDLNQIFTFVKPDNITGLSPKDNEENIIVFIEIIEIFKSQTILLEQKIRSLELLVKKCMDKKESQRFQQVIEKLEAENNMLKVEIQNYVRKIEVLESGNKTGDEMKQQVEQLLNQIAEQAKKIQEQDNIISNVEAKIKVIVDENSLIKNQNEEMMKMKQQLVDVINEYFNLVNGWEKSNIKQNLKNGGLQQLENINSRIMNLLLGSQANKSLFYSVDLLVQNMDECDEKVLKLEAKVQELESKIQELEGMKQKIENIAGEGDLTKEELAKLKTVYEQVLKEKEDLENKQREHEAKIQQLEKEKQELEVLIQEFNNKPVSKEVKDYSDTLRKFKDEYNKGIDKILREIGDKNPEIRDFIAGLKQQTDDVENIQLKFEILVTNIINYYESQLKTCEEEKNKLAESRNDLKQELERLKKEMTGVHNMHIRSLEKLESVIKEQCKENEQKAEQVAETIAVLEQNKEEKMEEVKKDVKELILQCQMDITEMYYNYDVLENDEEFKNSIFDHKNVENYLFKNNFALKDINEETYEKNYKEMCNKARKIKEKNPELKYYYDEQEKDNFKKERSNYTLVKKPFINGKFSPGVLGNKPKSMYYSTKK